VAAVPRAAYTSGTLRVDQAAPVDLSALTALSYVSPASRCLRLVVVRRCALGRSNLWSGSTPPNTRFGLADEYPPSPPKERVEVAASASVLRVRLTLLLFVNGTLTYLLSGCYL